MLDYNTQLNHQGYDKDLSYQLLTNDFMLRYQHINIQFFTDTFFYKTKGKSNCGNTCNQIFVRNRKKVFIYILCVVRVFYNIPVIRSMKILVLVFHWWSILKGKKTPRKLESSVIKLETHLEYWKNQPIGRIYLNFTLEFLRSQLGNILELETVPWSFCIIVLSIAHVFIMLHLLIFFNLTKTRQW